MRYIVVPQWQGSGSSRAMQLVDGAKAIGGDLPSSVTQQIDVPLEAGDAEGTGIHRYSSLRLVRRLIARALERGDEPVVAIGGDCGIEYGTVAHAAARHDLALVWLDAHPDAHDAATSPSGAFHGMVLRALVDDGIVPADRVVLAGTRAGDDAERAWLDETRIPVLDADAVRRREPLLEAVRATGARGVYVHIALDALDPSELTSVAFPEPFGLSADDLLGAVRALTDGFPLIGAGITEFSPAGPEAASDDLPTVLRILAALRPRG